MSIKSIIAIITLTMATAPFLLLGCNTQSVSTSSGHSNDPPTIKTPVGMFCFGGIPTAVDADKRNAEADQQRTSLPPTIVNKSNITR